MMVDRGLVTMMNILGCMNGIRRWGLDLVLVDSSDVVTSFAAAIVFWLMAGSWLLGAMLTMCRQSTPVLEIQTALPAMHLVC